MSNEDIQNLQKVVDEQIQDNMGMSMIYTIVSAAQEWMQERVSGSSSQAICRNRVLPTHKLLSAQFCRLPVDFDMYVLEGHVQQRLEGTCVSKLDRHHNLL